MNNATILIIDDDQELRENLTEILADEEYTVLSTYNGVDGLRLLVDHPVDLLLLDLKIPGISGREVLVNVKRTAPHVKVVIITGRPVNWHLNDHGEVSEEEELDLAKSDALLSKPFTIPALLEVIRTLLDGEGRSPARPARG
ncbi:MAG TPA: response regulator [Spirochaetia bacterium]|nr:response regulator [Spirochaetia bacterium]